MAQLFPTIGSVADQTDLDDRDRTVTEIESLCMRCEEQGVTRMLLTSIPYFREVIVMSFRCEHCGWTNNEIQSAGAIRPEGTLYTARILTREDLDRQIVRSASCEVIIPEYELTLPKARGQLTTVEGLIRDIISDLSADQPLRLIEDQVTHAKIQALIDKLKLIVPDDDDDDDESLEKKRKETDKGIPAFTIMLDDPAGNSFIEFIGSMSDPKWNLKTYKRTHQQNVDLALVSNDEAEKPSTVEDEPLSVDTGEEIYSFHGRCSSCAHPLDTLMKKVTIPYFKEVFIMSTNCDHCGYRDNEVKSGSAISEKGKRITLRVDDQEDLSRDILKSETSGLTVPEIDLVLQPGTLGGRFTTVEGLLEQVYEELSQKAIVGDSGVTDASKDRTSFNEFLKKLKAVKSAERPFTLILDDPLANSYIQSLYAPDPDPNLDIVSYERTWGQNEELGLNDMKVEGYDQSEAGSVGDGEREKTP